MSASNKLILVVEDNEAYRKTLEEKLSHANFTVLTAADGDTGLKLALEKRPDLMVVDLMLPKMNGAVLMSTLRQDEWGKGLPIMILTNIDPDDDILGKVMENKPCYYLLKPEANLDDIVGKIKTVLHLS